MPTTELYQTAISSLSTLGTMAARKSFSLRQTYCEAQDYTKLLNSNFCEDAQNCNNDGGEFMLAGSQFVNARRTDDKNLSFESADSNSSVKATARAFRKFTGDDGNTRLLLSTNTTISPVGNYVWSDGKMVMLVSEIIP